LPWNPGTAPHRSPKSTRACSLKLTHLVGATSLGSTTIKRSTPGLTVRGDHLTHLDGVG
jgi:hypothetical protein